MSGAGLGVNSLGGVFDMSTWRDVTSYSQGDKKRIPRVWELEGTPAKITVHRYSGIPDTWFVTCREIGLETKALALVDIDDAQQEAISIVQERICQRITELQDLFMAVRQVSWEDNDGQV